MKQVRPIAAFTALVTLAATAVIPVQAQVAPTLPTRPNPVNSNPVNSNPAPANPSIATPQSRPNDPRYEQARQELPEDLYVLYRIVDRMARANGLDNQAWRLKTASEYDSNAFATDANLIPVYNGLLDQLHSDVDALACVVGREMAHHTQKHTAVGDAQRAQMLAELQNQIQSETTAEIEDASNDARAASVGSSILSTVGGLFGGLGGLVGGLAGSAIGGSSQSRVIRAQERIQETYRTRMAEIEQHITEQIYKQNTEADRLGYRYMATAGFKPEGCVRAIEILKSADEMQAANQSNSEMAQAMREMVGNDADPSTPDDAPATSPTAMPDRITTLKQAMSEAPAENLAASGQTKLTLNAQPLNYNLSPDGSSLRINSRNGNQDVDQLFPN
ncbi:MAG TPA: M48 family metalloprotease [Trichocoleus sp.]|jgi:Zn-dependent protease with chaperone function